MPSFKVSKIGNLLNDLPICNFSSFFSESYGLKCFAENSNRPLSIRKCAFFAFGNPQVSISKSCNSKMVGKSLNVNDFSQFKNYGKVNCGKLPNFETFPKKHLEFGI